MARQLFDTTLYSEDKDLAVTVVSVPTEHLPDPRVASSPADVLDALQLRVVAEVPASHVADALAAILATSTAVDAAHWLAEPPDPVQISLGSDVERFRAWSDDVDEAETSLPRAGTHKDQELDIEAIRPPERVERKQPQRASKGDPFADDLREFARDTTTDSVVPFQRSPVDLFQLPDLLQLGDATRVMITTVRTNPLLMVWVGGGFLIFSGLRGAGKGLSAGLQYRLLKLFGLPDDVIRDQMSRRRRGRPPSS